VVDRIAAAVPLPACLVEAILLNTLRVLLVDADARQSHLISSRLAGANHTVLPTTGLEEAAEALSTQNFDAVVLGSPLPADGVADFAGKLRTLEMNRSASSRTAILSLSRNLSDGSAWQPSEDAGIDGYLAEGFDAKALTTAVTSLTKLACAAKESSGNPVSPSVMIFDPEELKAQVAYDYELLIEVVDLFLSEQLTQTTEMQEALANEEYSQLYLTAHTIKGSLASLHAGVARLRAEELESAAKERNRQHCLHLLSMLKRDLETLEPALSHLRDSCKAI
jgi:HPt (histidine-containing phosphotransfer) domain-containing protein/CheY-like chemotaxis protein